MKRSEGHFLTHEYDFALSSMQRLFEDEGLDRSPRLKNNKSLISRTKVLTEKYKNIKVDHLKQVYIEKMKQFGLHGEPVDVTKNINTVKPRIQLIQGFQINRHFYSFIIACNVLAFIIMSYLAVFTGYVIGFTSNQATIAAEYILKGICTFIFALVFIIRSVRKISHQGKDYKYIYDIVKFYWHKKRLVIDLVTLIYAVFFLAFPKIEGIAMIYFFYLYIAIGFSRKDIIFLEINYLSTRRQKLLLGLLKILFLNFFFAHTNAAILLGMARIDLPNSWLSVYGHLDGPWFEQYIYAFYWGTTIMMTVGFGDYLPVTPRQTVVVTFIEIVSCVVLSYNISEIGNIIKQLRQANQKVTYKRAVFHRMIRRDHKSTVQIINKQENKLNEIFQLKRQKSLKKVSASQAQIHTKYTQKSKKIAREKHLDRQLEQKIFKHINQMGISKSNLQYLERKEFLEELPENLRDQYLKVSNRRVFMRILFFGKLKPSTLEKFAYQLTDQMLYPGSSIPVKSTDFVILDQGTIGFAYSKKGSSMNGEIMESMTVQRDSTSVLITNTMFYMRDRSRYQIIAEGYPIIYRLKYQTFLQAIKESPMDQQYYFCVLHKHLVNPYAWEFKKCPRCKSSFHTIFHCYKATYMPLRSLIITKRFVKPGVEQQRKSTFRRKTNQFKRINSMKHWKQLFRYISGQIIPGKYKKHPPTQEQIKKNEKFSFQESFDSKQEKFKHFVKTQGFKDIVVEAVRYYETGYYDQFWNIEADLIHNYHFYFPNNNSSRFVRTPIRKLISSSSSKSVHRVQIFSDRLENHNEDQKYQSRAQLLKKQKKQ